MTKFYNEEELQSIAKRLKVIRAVFYSLIGLFVAGYVVMCFFMNYARRDILLPVSMAYAFIATAIVMFVLYFYLLPDKSKRNRINSLTRAYKHKLTAKYVAKSQLKTLRRDVLGYELTFISEGKTYLLYLEENELNFEFKEADYDLELSDNFIYSAKEHADE